MNFVVVVDVVVVVVVLKVPHICNHNMSRNGQRNCTCIFIVKYVIVIARY